MESIQLIGKRKCFFVGSSHKLADLEHAEYSPFHSDQHTSAAPIFYNQFEDGNI